MLYLLQTEILTATRLGHCMCIIIPMFVVINQTVAEIWDFSILKMAADSYLGFYKFKVLIAGLFKKANMRHRIKFRGDQSNRG